MKNYILIILMIVTILLSGCGKDEKGTEVDRGNDNNNQQEVESGEQNGEDEADSEEDEPNSDIGKYEVNFYLFYSSSCGHCHSEREWIASIQDEYSYVNFIMYEVSEYSELFTKVTKAYNLENEYVPVTIIGNNYMVGYSEAKNRKFIRYIEELSTFESCDVVQTVIDGGDVEACMAKNEK